MQINRPDFEGLVVLVPRYFPEAVYDPAARLYRFPLYQENNGRKSYDRYLKVNGRTAVVDQKFLIKENISSIEVPLEVVARWSQGKLGILTDSWELLLLRICDHNSRCYLNDNFLSELLTNPGQSPELARISS